MTVAKLKVYRPGTVKDDAPAHHKVIKSDDLHSVHATHTAAFADVVNGFHRIVIPNSYPKNNNVKVGIQVVGTPLTVARWRLFGTFHVDPAQNAPPHEKLNTENKRLVAGGSSLPTELDTADEDIWVPFDLADGGLPAHRCWIVTQPFSFLLIAGISAENPTIYTFAQ